MMNKKIKLLLVVCFSMFLLVGWGDKKIELLDNNRLINLDKAIEYAKPGGSWEKNDYTSDSTEIDKKTEQNVVQEQDASQEDIDVGDSNIKYIKVSGESISYCGTNISLDKLYDFILRDKGDEICFVLTDDWAEAHVYRDVKAVLVEAKESVGISYSEER